MKVVIGVVDVMFNVDGNGTVFTAEELVGGTDGSHNGKATGALVAEDEFHG